MEHRVYKNGGEVDCRNFAVLYYVLHLCRVIYISSSVDLSLEFRFVMYLFKLSFSALGPACLSFS